MHSLIEQECFLPSARTFEYGRIPSASSEENTINAFSLAMGSSNSLLRGIMANELVTSLRLRGDLDYGEQAPHMNSCSLERP